MSRSPRRLGTLLFVDMLRLSHASARIGPDAYDDVLARKGCRPMDFTGRPMRGFVFVGRDGMRSDKDLEYWLGLALAYNPTAKKSGKKKN